MAIQIQGKHRALVVGTRDDSERVSPGDLYIAPAEDLRRMVALTPSQALALANALIGTVQTKLREEEEENERQSELEYRADLLDEG